MRPRHALSDESAHCSARGMPLPPICPMSGRCSSLLPHCKVANLDGALPYLVGAAQSAASVIRDRFSPDAWRALTDLSESINVAIDPPTESAMFERTNGALRIITSFSSLAQENMSQLAGWRFLELGRRIERAIATCRFVRQFAFGKLGGAGRKGVG